MKYDIIHILYFTTFIVEKFGREQYESFIEINFILDPDACSIFDGSLKAEDLYRKISAFDATKRLTPGKTLIFLDEIQECANARTALKSFALDGRFDVIASGSLLGIKYKNKKSQERHMPKSIPVGYERQVVMHSLDFEEFLWGRGITEDAIEVLKGYCERREVVPEAVNRKYANLLKEYMIVGGMPAVVNAYVACGDFGPVQEEQEKILASYVDDIHKYADTTDIPKIEACYQGNAKGGLYENLIAGMLERKNIALYYFKTEKGTREVEFAMERDGGIVPVEVKSSNGATLSLNEILEMPQVPYGYKFVDGNVGVSGKKVTLPHYMAMFI